MSEQATARVTIKNRLGLHARPAMALVDLASTFGCEVLLQRADDEGGEAVDGKSIMQVMMLAATQGTELLVNCRGADAEAARDAIEKLVKQGFGED